MAILDVIELQRACKERGLDFRAEVTKWQVFFNGSPADNLNPLRADTETGELTVMVSNRETGKYDIDLTSPYRVKTKVYTGKVEIRERQHPQAGGNGTQVSNEPAMLPTHMRQQMESAQQRVDQAAAEALEAVKARGPH